MKTTTIKGRADFRARTKDQIVAHETEQIWRQAKIEFERLNQGLNDMKWDEQGEWVRKNWFDTIRSRDK